MTATHRTWEWHIAACPVYHIHLAPAGITDPANLQQEELNRCA